MNTVEIKTPRATHQVPEEKLTSLKLYVTAREAYEMWQADPDRIKVLDVHTFEERIGGLKVTLPQEPMIVGAVGAALIALDLARKAAPNKQ